MIASLVAGRLSLTVPAAGRIPLDAEGSTCRRRQYGRLPFSETPRRASMPLSGYRILIVEDEALIALDLAHALEDLHAIVVGSVDNLADARKAVSEEKIDCAVLDVHLRGQSVAALVSELDARHIPRL
jgi:PleD family two-component response regulator